MNSETTRTSLMRRGVTLGIAWGAALCGASPDPAAGAWISEVHVSGEEVEEPWGAVEVSGLDPGEGAELLVIEMSRYRKGRVLQKFTLPQGGASTRLLSDAPWPDDRWGLTAPPAANRLTLSEVDEEGSATRFDFPEVGRAYRGRTLMLFEGPTRLEETSNLYKDQGPAWYEQNPATDWLTLSGTDQAAVWRDEPVWDLGTGVSQVRWDGAVSGPEFLIGKPADSGWLETERWRVRVTPGWRNSSPSRIPEPAAAAVWAAGLAGVWLFGRGRERRGC